MSRTFTLVATFLVAITSLAWAVVARLSLDQWLVMLQSLGTLLALVWVIYTGMLQDRTSSRDVVLQSLNLLKADLEDLTKSIEVEMGKLQSKAAAYEARYHAGERTAYIVPLTAANGRRLRALYSSEKVRTPQLERRLRTYVTMFEPLLKLTSTDPVFLSIIESSPHGRAYMSIRAALSGSEEEALVFIKKLEAHDTGSPRSDYE